MIIQVEVGHIEEEEEADPGVLTVPVSLSIGDFVLAPQLLSEGALGPVTSLRVVQCVDSGWMVERMDFREAKIESRDGVNPDWIVEQPLCKPGKWNR